MTDYDKSFQALIDFEKTITIFNNLAIKNMRVLIEITINHYFSNTICITIVNSYTSNRESRSSFLYYNMLQVASIV